MEESGCEAVEWLESKSLLKMEQCQLMVKGSE